MNSKKINYILIWFIRIIPMLSAMYVFCNSVEVIYSIHTENYIEYYDGDKLLYIVYNSPISDMIAEYVSVSWLTIELMFITSYAYKFCAYHRVFIWYLVVAKIIQLMNHFTAVNAIGLTISYSIMLFFLLSISIALYLYQNYGDRAI